MGRELSRTLWRTLLPLVFGGAVAVWLVKKDIDLDTLRAIHFDTKTIIAVILAFVAVCGRDFGLAWRFHTISYPDLTWKRSIRTDIMCAFTSAITPSVVGGSALAIFYLNREGISIGRATSLTLTTLFLDELFFVIFCPIILLMIPMHDLFSAGIETMGDSGTFFTGIEVVFWLVYTGVVVWAAALYIAIIGCPQAARSIMYKMAQWRFLRRFASKITSTADNMEATSQWVKGRSARWWLNVFGSTVLSWFSRYFVVCFLFAAFVPGVNWFLVFARQFVVWVVLMVCPTPGGSGISEWLFATYYGDLIGSLGMAAVIALIWRVLTYYIYLIAGCMLLPGYFGENSKK